MLVAMGVFVILGTALVGLMAAAVDAWRRGEAGRLVNERVQALQRQVADDLAAAVLDQPPPPDFHFALDTLYDLPRDPANPGSPSTLLDASSELKEPRPADVTKGGDLTYFAPTSRPGTGTVVLRIDVPFLIGAALLQARLDVLDPGSAAQVFVTRRDPAADPPVPDETRWRLFADLTTPGRQRLGGPSSEGMDGGEADISEAVQGGNIVYIKAVLVNQSDDQDAAQFLRADRLRAGGRPVLLLDCYRDLNALPQQPRPTFAAFVRNGAQVLTFTRTLPPEAEQLAARAGGGLGGAEYLNSVDDNSDKRIDEAEALRPVAGRAQVVYVFRPYHTSLGKPGLGVLRRAFEAPLRQDAVGAPPSQLPANIAALADETPSQDFIPSVLYFGASFWGADTTTWEDRPDLEPGYATKYDGTTTPYPRPASTEWLSSRYLPEQVQVTVVLEPDRGKRVSTGLIQAIEPDFPAADEARLGVVSTLSFDDARRASAPVDTFLRDPRHFIKIDDEWVFYSRIGSPTEFVIPRYAGDRDTPTIVRAARGARGTRPVAHASGAEVFRGTTSVFTVRLPAYHHWER